MQSRNLEAHFVLTNERVCFKFVFPDVQIIDTKKASNSESGEAFFISPGTQAIARINYALKSQGLFWLHCYEKICLAQLVS